jgi:uracil-DNA glycosylase
MFSGEAPGGAVVGAGADWVGADVGGDFGTIVNDDGDTFVLDRAASVDVGGFAPFVRNAHRAIPAHEHASSTTADTVVRFVQRFKVPTGGGGAFFERRFELALIGHPYLLTSG